MSRRSDRITFDVSAPDRRALLSQLCGVLNDRLGQGNRETEGCVLSHWHARAGGFSDVPAAVIGAVLDSWSDAGGGLCDLEFSGYLDTDEGHRAWGFIATRPDPQPLGSRLTVKRCDVVEKEDEELRVIAVIGRTTDGCAVNG